MSRRPRRKANQETTSSGSAPKATPDLAEAARYHQAGDIQRAEVAYRQILAIEPEQPDALHLLGIIASQRGSHDEACDLVRRAIAARPGAAMFHNTLGAVLKELGRREEATAALRQALALAPDCSDAHYNLAGLMHTAGELEDAAEHYRAFLNANPGDASAHNNLGCVLLDLGRAPEATAQFEATLQLAPDHAHARQNLERVRQQPQTAATAPRPARTLPLIITAPTARNGVTLVQRLLNSSREIIIYGEDAHLFQVVPNMVMQRQVLHRRMHAEGEATRRRFLDETTDFWTSGLWPDSELYIKAMAQCYGQLVDVYQESSRRYGYDRWGIKHPMTEYDELQRLRALMPDMPVVFIYRNPFDVARSAKARRFYTDLEGLTQLGRRWQSNVQAVLDNPLDPMLIIKYEDLVAEPAEHIGRIEQFCGVSGIDHQVMARRFNTFRGPAEEGMSDTEYISPVPLTPEEHSLVAETTANALRTTGYSTTQVEKELHMP